MRLARLQSFALSLPHVTVVKQWGECLVHKVAARMFLVIIPDGGVIASITFKCTLEEFAELTEIDGIGQAPYCARRMWVQVQDPAVLPEAELHARIRRSYELVTARLPKKVRAALGLASSWPNRREQHTAHLQVAKAGSEPGTLLAANLPIHPDVRIGHVHLKVADLRRALDFYVGVLGFELTQRYGAQAAFVSAGGYHHHIGLNTWESLGSPPPPPGSTGLYHTAIVYPTRAALADAFRRLLSAKIPLDGASDHGVSEALYLRDPDQNGVELYWDRPPSAWPRNTQGGLAMTTMPLDLDSLLTEPA